MLPELGIVGVEVAPSRVWDSAWRDLRPTDVSAYRHQIENAGLSAIGLHSLFYDQPHLGLFKHGETRKETLDFMAHLSRVCRDLGGRTLIYGGGRHKGQLSVDDANRETLNIFMDLVPMIEGHGTYFCFEPLGPNDSDFINSAYDSISLVKTLNSPGLKLQLDAKALVQNREATLQTFQDAGDHLVHFHANEPDLGVLGSSGEVDHAAMGRMLREIGYEGYVSIEQKLLNEADPLADVAKSAAVLRECYS